MGIFTLSDDAVEVADGLAFAAGVDCEYAGVKLKKAAITTTKSLEMILKELVLNVVLRVVRPGPIWPRFGWQ